MHAAAVADVMLGAHIRYVHTSEQSIFLPARSGALEMERNKNYPLRHNID